MIIDLLHNKIVADLITADFERSVREALVPKLRERLGESFFGIQMYEDYISDNLTIEGEWYYPMTALTDGGAETVWVKWSVDKKRFEDGAPYAYVGEENIEFALCDEAPEQLAAGLGGRAYFCESGLVKIKVDTPAKDATFLSGKYSQSFVDEMARQLTPAIEKHMSVSGIADSSLSLMLVFAPESYMEHTSESVTYRRLLMTDKTSAPRDFWVKWTRLDGKGAYTVADSPESSEIRFEIAEGTSQKIREKEYRFLLRSSKDEYHRSMGRKNITEWRELVKRALKRGELTKVEEVIELAQETRELEAQLAAVLGIDVPAEKPEEPVIEFAPAEDDDFARAMQLAREAVELAKAEEEAEELFDEGEEEDENEPDELEEFYREDDEAPVIPELPTDEDEAAELDEITKMAMEALKLAAAEPVGSEDDESADDAEEIELAEVSEDEPEEETEDEAVEQTSEDAVEELSEDFSEEAVEFSKDEPEEIATPIVIVPDEPCAEEYEDGFDEIDDEEALEDDEDAEYLEDVRRLEPDDEPTPAPSVKKVPSLSDEERREDLEERIRRELETKLRLEYESRARERAEEEAARLRLEQEQLRLEVEKLQTAAKLAEAERARALEEERIKGEELRARLEQQMRAEAKERERLAEAALLAVEEKRKLDEEKLRLERERLEEERRAAEERARREEAERIEAQRQAEAERIRREAEERAKASITEAAAEGDNYTYTSKLVKLLFRRSIDPNITGRIYEIIKATLEYYGKENVNMRIKASIPDPETVCLEFVQIPLEEMELLSNIIKVLGNSGLGIAKAIVE